MDLVEFLTARLDEDEQVAKLLSGRRWYAYDDGWVVESVPGETWADGSDYLPNRHSSYWPMFDPARALADVEAKRRILRNHGDQHDCGDPRSYEYPYVGCQDLRLLALPYADDPDYQPEWSP